MNALLARFDAIDTALVRAGFHATSPWWRRELERFALAGVGRWVVRAGRRAGKSSTMCRLAVAKALADDWTIPPGDRAVIAFVSVDRKEASARLHTIAEILRALGVPFDERADEIEIHGRPVVFRVVTSSLSGVVGFTAIALFADEMARWEVDGANPAAEIMRSLRPTTATVPSAIEACVSSPWGLADAHYDLVEQGDTAGQVVSIGATWECNPLITEEWTRTKEPDPRAWARAYAAVPGGTESGAFDPARIVAAFDRFGDGAPPIGEPFLVLDPSSLAQGGDDFAFGVAAHTATGGVTLLTCEGARGGTPLPEVIDRIAALAREHGATKAFSDQRENAGLTALFAQRGIALTAIAWTLQSKHTAGQTLQRLFSEELLALCAHDRLRRELMNLRAELRPNDLVTYPTNGRDYVSLLFTLAHAIDGGYIIPEGLDAAPLAGMPDRADPEVMMRSVLLAGGIGGGFAAPSTMSHYELATMREQFARGGVWFDPSYDMGQTLAEVEYALTHGGSTTHYSGTPGSGGPSADPPYDGQWSPPGRR